MSLQLINQYHSKVERLIQYGGSRNESSIRSAFQGLLEGYASGKNLVLVPELEFKTRLGATVYPDGTLKNAVRQDLGYWESKDERDDLGAEIELKFAKGYPDTNILFEDSRQVVLFQNGKEVGRAGMGEANKLHALLTRFISYEPPFVRTFREAVARFQNDLPDLLGHLRQVIEEEAKSNPTFTEKRDRLLGLAQKAINPHLTPADIREMLIQHILTEDIFVSVFNEAQFHRENNIARELYNVTGSFFTGALRRNTLAKIEPYYAVIRSAAANISDHHEKQKFLKVIYENFYKAYNPAGADRLGIVYTPNEIVRFMIEAADHLVYRHFGKLLGDKDVNILDPATGTGTFITEIIEYLPRAQLEHKYKRELFCNEVALLPYYTANLNIEYTYQQKMSEYVPFENIIFVDTLDNLNYIGATGQYSMFELTAENLERIKRQNEKKISVIIGNPPYNANQLNENENNKNRPYPGVDERIKQTYVRASTAQKTKVYDMYARFLRWASDRVGDNGVVAYIVNRSFIDSRTFDGFRKVVTSEFSEVYAIDLGGDVRKNPKLSGTKHNVFGIQTGVAILFLVRKEKQEGKARIYYLRRSEMETAKEKLEWLGNTHFGQLAFEHITPDKNHNWIHQAESEWDELLPLATKETKLAQSQGEEQAVFKLFSLGVITARDEWVYDETEQSVQEKIEHLVGIYNQDVARLFGKFERGEVADELDYSIKWTRAVKNDLFKGIRYSFQSGNIVDSLYRPFVRKKLYFNRHLNEMQYQMPSIFPDSKAKNIVIAVNVGNKPFNVLASNRLVDYHFNGDSQCLPLYRYDKDGNRLENITRWGLERFRERYGKIRPSPIPPTPLKEGGLKPTVPPLTRGGLGGDSEEPEGDSRDITRQDIFHYVYGVLHDPVYRQKYELNLKREFPRVPFYEDFAQWAAWGQRLMDLHLNYETVAPYPLARVDAAVTPKAKLKADKAKGVIDLDGATVLSSVPPEAWDYKLGNRSAIEWVLDRYKETKPKDPTIRERFNTYRFADHKEKVIDLLMRVCTVSVETVRVVREMEGAERG